MFPGGRAFRLIGIGTHDLVESSVTAEASLRRSAIVERLINWLIFGPRIRLRAPFRQE